jgi:hypothetical protein
MMLDVPKVIGTLVLLGASGCTMFMRPPQIVQFKDAVVVPSDDVFLHDGGVGPVWMGRIEPGSECVYQCRKADCVYIACPIAVDATKTKMVLPDER